ncbi:MAG: hypothetical protein ACKOW9_05410 [Candidatus Paceibacterota bacterium]
MNIFKKIKINPVYKKYLPSKTFGLFVAGGVTVVVIAFGVSALFERKESFSQKNQLAQDGTTLSGLLQSDTDLDGVFDWEEALWGTDKNKKATFNDVPDNVYIAERKAALGSSSDTAELNETDKFAREFFASYVALKSSGEDADSINTFSRALGEKIGDPTLVDIYGAGDIKVIVAPDKADITQYYTDIQNIFEKYRNTGMGDEIDIVNSGLLGYTEGRTKVDYGKLNNIGKAYQSFASEFMKLKVPTQYVNTHIQIANSAHNTGTSVISMVNIIDDPIVGLTGITQYQKYSAEFMDTAGDLENDLVQLLE